MPGVKRLFWASISAIFYVYLGFPLLLAVRGLLFRRLRPAPNGLYTPKVSVIVAAHNEAAVITAKLDNLRATAYPLSQVEIIVASDGSDDGTNEQVAQYQPEVRLLILPRQGKNRAISQAALTARGEILVFTDADSMLPADALSALIAPFAAPDIGGVGGDYRHTGQNGLGQTGERVYWNYDRRLKQLQSRSGSVSAASGALYAVRRSLFQPVPPAVTDDFFTAMQIVSSHYQFVFEPRAVAYGPPAPSPKAEFRRKVRIMTRGFHGVWLLRHLLNPFEYGFFAIQLFTHKVLRRLMVIPLLLLSIMAPLLWAAGGIYKLTAMSLAALHGAAIAGFFLRNTSLGQQKILSLPFHLDMVYVAAGIALINTILGKKYAAWGSERTTSNFALSPRQALFFD